MCAKTNGLASGISGDSASCLRLKHMLVVCRQGRRQDLSLSLRAIALSYTLHTLGHFVLIGLMLQGEGGGVRVRGRYKCGAGVRLRVKFMVRVGVRVGGKMLGFKS